MFKKSLIMLLCLSLVACAFLTGCGKDSKKDTNKDNTESSDTAATKPNYKVKYFDGDDGVYAEVNGETVSSDEFKYFLMMQMYSDQSAAGEDAGKDFWTDGKIKSAMDNALNQAVLMYVYKSGAADAGIKFTDDDQKTIDSNIDSAKQYYGEDMYNLQLEGMGITEDMYKNFSTLSMYANKWYEKFSADAVSDEDISKTFHKDYVKAKHILIKKTNDDGTDVSADAYTKIEDIKKQLDGGADFDTLMNENSEDPGLQSAPNGYVFTKGQLVQEFEDAAFKLEPGQISDIVESNYGYHILMKVELTDDDLNETTSDSSGQQITVKEAIKSSLASDKFTQHIEDVKSKATVKVNKKEENSFKKNAEKLYNDFSAKMNEISQKLQAQQQAAQGSQNATSSTGDGSSADNSAE